MATEAHKVPSSVGGSSERPQTQKDLRMSHIVHAKTRHDKCDPAFLGGKDRTSTCLVQPQVKPTGGLWRLGAEGTLNRASMPHHTNLSTPKETREHQAPGEPAASFLDGPGCILVGMTWQSQEGHTDALV